LPGAILPGAILQGAIGTVVAATVVIALGVGLVVVLAEVAGEGAVQVVVVVVSDAVGIRVLGDRGPASRTPTGAAAWTLHPAPPGQLRYTPCMGTCTFPHDECRPRQPPGRGQMSK
jgi:hypothetical protein